MKLSAFIGRLTGISSDGFRVNLARDIGYECRVNLIPDEFHVERDPYGTPWKPQKKPTNKILYKSGDLFNSFSVSPSANGVHISSSSIYAATHNYGSTRRNIPARPILPNQHTGIGEIWLTAIRKVFSKSIKEALRS